MSGARVLNFHSVGVEDLPVPLFRQQLEFLAAHFPIVPLPELVETLTTGDLAQTDAIVLTFDDGLRNQYRFAYPVLRELGIPATFYVCPGLIESRAWLWTAEMRCRLAVVGSPERKSLFAADGPGRWDTESILQWAKLLPRLKREAAADALRAATRGFSPSQHERERYDLMTWDELRQLDPQLITIGSHSFSHPILSALAPGELEREVGDSRRWLEAELRRPIEHFCYPNGTYDEAAASCVRRYYRSACSTIPGSVRYGCDLFALPRIQVANDLPTLAWRLHRPAS